MMGPLELPQDCEILSISSSGYSYWVHTTKIQVRLTHGMIEEYFIKVGQQLCRA